MMQVIGHSREWGGGDKDSCYLLLNCHPVSVAFKLSQSSDSTGWLVKLQMAVPHPQVGPREKPENVHF